MKGIAAYMVLSLLTRSRVSWDDPQHCYPRPVMDPPGQQSATEISASRRAAQPDKQNR